MLDLSRKAGLCGTSIKNAKKPFQSIACHGSLRFWRWCKATSDGRMGKPLFWG
jgi:hypothetical protein